jgi:hypothetical protein
VDQHQVDEEHGGVVFELRYDVLVPDLLHYISCHTVNPSYLFLTPTEHRSQQPVGSVPRRTPD